ncbi:MAG: YbaN family protein [Candidatus Krumholzibacteriota bacterium]|nr:YbaN family protein [Candidatus Krumholzibacteriota bacterium]
MKKYLLIFTGYTSLVLGAVGIFLPLLPTTPFLLLASACFFRSSEKLHDWLINHRIFGNYIRCYQQFRAISFRIKALTITALWLFIGYSIVFVVSALWIRILLLIIAVAVTAHIALLRTLTNEMLADLKKNNESAHTPLRH